MNLSIANATAQEGNPLEFVVTLDAPSEQTVTVDYKTLDGTARAGRDYEATSGSLTFAPGETSKTVSVATLLEERGRGKETRETVALRLSNATNATITDDSAVGTIEPASR